MIDVKVKVTRNDVGPLMQSIKDGIKTGLTRTTLRIADEGRSLFIKAVKERFGSRTGKLWRSFQATLIASNPHYARAGVFSDLVYAHVLDQVSFTIRPKEKKNLAIPISTFVKNKVGLWPRNFPGKLQFVKTKHGKFLIEKKGKETFWHYKLQPQVTIHGNPYIDEVASEINEIAQRIFGDSVEVIVRKAVSA